MHKGGDGSTILDTCVTKASGPLGGRNLQLWACSGAQNLSTTGILEHVVGRKTSQNPTFAKAPYFTARKRGNVTANGPQRGSIIG